MLEEKPQNGSTTTMRRPPPPPETNGKGERNKDSMPKKNMTYNKPGEKKEVKEMKG